MQTEDTGTQNVNREAFAIPKEYVRRLLEKETREEEKGVLQSAILEKDKEVESLFQSGSLTILKDVEKVDAMVQGILELSIKIDKVEATIEVNTVRHRDSKQSIAEIKRTKERVKSSLEGVAKLQMLIEIIEHLDRVSTKIMLEIERTLNKRENMKDSEVRAIYQWLRVVSRLESISKYFVDYRFFSKVQNVIANAHSRLKTVANLLTQWWICEITTGIAEIVQALHNPKAEHLVLSKSAKESRAFAKANRVLARIGKYIYEELGDTEEFVLYVNSARTRELGKLCKEKFLGTDPQTNFAHMLGVFEEFLHVDKEIRQVVPQKIDVAVEKYDCIFKAKIESYLALPECSTLSQDVLLAGLKEFFQAAERADVFLKETAEILVQLAYKTITGECKKTKEKLKGVFKSKEDEKKKMAGAKTEIIGFFRTSKEFIKNIDQMENELDEILLKCVNELVQCFQKHFSSMSVEDAVVLKGFTEELKASLETEIGEYKDRATAKHTVQTSVPVLEEMEKAEQEIFKETEEAFKKNADSILRKAKIKKEKITNTSEIPPFIKQAVSLVERSKKNVSRSVIQAKIRNMLSIVTTYLPYLKTYQQVDALENDFVLLYKLSQTLDIKEDEATTLLSIFTDIDHTRREKGKELEDAIEDDLKDVLQKYKISK
ncbi:hypothetical protein NECID01_1261 [Nematocida sp. AWRm77]|nr:hypothetical protein NECID01_1261 [Nematocida sp. AWRm77]